MKTILYGFSKLVQNKASDYYENLRIPENENVECFEDLKYDGENGNSLFMDIFRPVIRYEKKLPVIIMIHGGGLLVGNRKMVSEICQQFAERGFLVFNLDYRLLTEANACEEIADVCSGFRYAESVIEQYKGDNDRIFVLSESAGAYLALYSILAHSHEPFREKVGCRVSGLKVRKLACFSGMFYTSRFDLIGAMYPMQIYGKRMIDPGFMRYMNPENENVISHMPPMLLTTSDADFLKKYTLRYGQALKKNNKVCKIMHYGENKELIHAFPVYKPMLPESQEIIKEICGNFFRG